MLIDDYYMYCSTILSNIELLSWVVIHPSVFIDVCSPLLLVHILTFKKSLQFSA